MDKKQKREKTVEKDEKTVEKDKTVKKKVTGPGETKKTVKETAKRSQQRQEKARAENKRSWIDQAAGRR